MNPPSIIPVKRRFHRKQKKATQSAPPAALVLTAASADFVDDQPTVTMQFDRAIDVSSMDVTTIRVGTVTTGSLYQGMDGPIVVDARTVQVNLNSIDTYDEPNVKLFADSDNGIKAVDDGGTWAGTGGTNLPFP